MPHLINYQVTDEGQVNDSSVESIADVYDDKTS